MKVTLINRTSYALNLLLFTKATRLNMTPGLLEEIANKPQAEKLAEIQAMARTIKSSWEFLDVTFLVEGLSRAAAQQVTRTRTASFAMQSQRVTDVSTMEVVLPGAELTSTQSTVWGMAVRSAKQAYSTAVELGIPLQDARGLLPINTSCNFVAKYNLRAFTDMIKSRSSLRVQGEYAEMAQLMKAQVLEVWPWSEPFFATGRDAALEILSEVVGRMGLKVGSGDAWEISKAMDLLRGD